MRERSSGGYGSSSMGGKNANKNFKAGYSAAKKAPGKKTINESAGYAAGWAAGQAAAKKAAKSPQRPAGKLSIKEKIPASLQRQSKARYGSSRKGGTR